MKKKVIILISGSGSNMEALIKASRKDDFPADIIAVISDKGSAGGLLKAQEQGVPTHVFERKDYDSKQAHEEAILQCLGTYEPDIICLAGYMRLLSASMISPYRGRILNIHPSILPLFPGLNTHQRALDAGVKVAGCTVHLVTEDMDEGPILAQAVIPILSHDDADSLAKRVLKAEHHLYAAALAQFISGKSDTVVPDAQLFSL